MNFLFLNSSRSKFQGGNEKSILLAIKALKDHTSILAYRNEEVGKHFSVTKYRLPFLNEIDLHTIISLIIIVIRHRIDVIIPSTRKDYAIAGIVSRICRIRNVLWLGTTIDLKNKRIYNLVFNIMADGIIVNAEKIRETLLRSSYMRPERIWVVYYGIDPEVLARKIQEEIPKPFPFLITGIGRIEKNKGFDFLIRSFQRFVTLTGSTESGIVIMGEGPSIDELKELAKRLGLENRILFTGFVPNPYACLKQSDVFTLTSIKEGLSIALLEAMYLGIAPVSTYAGGVREVIEDGKNGFLLDYGDEEKLAAILAKLYRDPSLKEKIAAEARNKVVPMFSLDKLQHEIVSFCRSMMKLHKTSS